MNTKVIGHEKVIDFFAKAIKNNNLSHAYCFIGPDHVGKRKVAETIVAELLDVKFGFLNSSPDYWFVDRETDEKTEKLKKDISVEQIKDLVAFLHQSAFKKNGYKVAIIDNAGFLNKSGSNSLLKSLEEMYEKTIIFLLVNNTDGVLPTIMSRSQKIFFAPVPDKSIYNYLKSIELDEDKVKKITGLACGLPGKAIEWLNGQEALQKQEQEKIRFESLFNKPFYIKLQSVDELFGDKKDNNKARTELAEVLDLWHQLVVDYLKAKFGSKSPSLINLSFLEDISLVNLTAVEAKIVQAKAKLRENVHPRLLVEQILLEMP